ncbi:High mobility group B protein 1 [Morus notabilis]|uniref:High mobility group B protein 1 n=1 Tax=Morus notabilis TaxID=981085 RepID=W9RDH1_9ROSA|nr:HMG1/2-like protein [Morus notabilis]EXB83378.1 High mobility group B protein 1 [Morus notabilis]
MRGPKTAAIAHKKPDVEILKKSKAGATKTKKEKASKKNSDAPKRPASAFFVFMEEFRKSYKENYPDVKSVAVVGKAGGEKWKSMSDADKAPYVEKASKRKAEYEKALEAYKKLHGNGGDEKPEESEKSGSEVHEGSGDSGENNSY